MVIKRSPSGKYYIAPSPPSFYKSPTKPSAPSPTSGSGGTSGKTEKQLIEEGRARGKAYLEAHPEAFGGGIDPKTGIRYVGGKRVSVAGAGEVPGVKGVPTLQKARAISGIKQTAIQIQRARQKISPLSLRPTPLSKLTPLNTPRTGRGTFTRAVDVGGGKMQDVIFRYANGRIIKRTPIGKKFKQTKKFKEREKKEKAKIVTFGIGDIKKVTGKVVLDKIIEGADIISGGAITESRINKREDKVNKEITTFNKKYGGRELTESEYKKAQSISKSLENKQVEILKDKDKLASSVRSKVYGFFDPLAKRETSKQKTQRLEKNKPIAKKREKRLNIVNKKLKTEKSGLKKWKLNNEKKLLKHEIAVLRGEKKQEFFAGTVPIVPAMGIPSGVTNIKFIGRQKTLKGGKILTDIAFKTSTGRTGVARGLTVTKGKTSASAVLGRSGKTVFKLPSGKKKFINIKTFIGREDSATIMSKVNIGKKIALYNKQKKIGTLTKIKTNVKALKQLGVGRVASVKGKQFIKPSIIWVYDVVQKVIRGMYSLNPAREVRFAAESTNIVLTYIS